MKATSLRAYARHRGCTLAAVQEARASRRITVDANGKIPDVAEADRQWAANTDATRRPITGPAAERQPPQRTAVESVALWDEAMGCHVASGALFVERDALSLLVGALTSHALAACDAAELKKRIAKCLHDVAEHYGADRASAQRAKEELQLVIEMLGDES